MEATLTSGARTRRLFGRHPIGYAFVAPYVIFLGALFAYPLGLDVWISFRDYFFAAPGAEVERPFIGLRNYRDVLGDSAFRRAVLNVLEFIVINVPLTVAIALIL